MGRSSRRNIRQGIPHRVGVMRVIGVKGFPVGVLDEAVEEGGAAAPAGRKRHTTCPVRSAEGAMAAALECCPQ